MLSVRDLQRLFTAAGYYNGGIDGDIGPKTLNAVDRLLANNDSKLPVGMSKVTDARRMIMAAQIVLDAAGHEPGTIDGYAGHNTLEAFNSWAYEREHGRREIVASRRLDDQFMQGRKDGTLWPMQYDVEQFYGAVGTNQVRVEMPYTMVLAWDVKQTINSFLCHEIVADDVQKIFERTLDHYGEERLKKLNLHKFGGCLNVRKMRGGTKYSMHSWGIAIDLDPANNQLRWNSTRAKFAHKNYNPFWRIVEDTGAISLGRERDFDWMHFQFARV